MINLFNIGINEDELKNILEICPNVKDISKEEIKNKINILESIGCNERHIRNIIISNPMYLDLINEDIFKLINRLLEIGFDTLNLLFDSNPYILNLDSFEIDNYIKDRIDNGEILEDIVDDLDSNPYLFNEI